MYILISSHARLFTRKSDKTQHTMEIDSLYIYILFISPLYSSPYLEIVRAFSVSNNPRKNYAFATISRGTIAYVLACASGLNPRRACRIRGPSVPSLQLSGAREQMRLGVPGSQDRRSSDKSQCQPILANKISVRNRLHAYKKNR